MSGRSSRKRGRRAPAPAPPPVERGGRAAKRATAQPQTKAGRRSGGVSTRTYDTQAADARESEYHYGSDFGDDSEEPSEPEDRLESESESSPEPDPASDSDFSLGGRISPGEIRRTVVRPPSPEPLWIQRERPIPELELPESSDDLLVPKDAALRVSALYEILRRFRHPVRLSPFRYEDLCAAISCDEQTNLLVEIHIALLKALLREEDSQQTHFGPIDHKDSVNITLYMLDVMTWPEVLRVYVESDKSFDREVLQTLSSSEYPFTGVDDRIKVLEFLCDQFLITNPIREDLISEGIEALSTFRRLIFNVFLTFVFAIFSIYSLRRSLSIVSSAGRSPVLRDLSRRVSSRMRGSSPRGRPFGRLAVRLVQNPQTARCHRLHIRYRKTRSPLSPRTLGFR